MNQNAPLTNRQKVSETTLELKRKGIKSPKLKDMHFTVYDKTTRALYCFKRENKNRYCKKVESLRSLHPDHVLMLSHKTIL
jgi:hypothetical protein